MERTSAEPARVRVPLARLDPGEQRLTHDAGHYLSVVRRLRAGDRFLAFDPGRGLEADGVVLSVSGADLRVRLGPVGPAARVASQEITWLQGLPKGDKMDGIVRDATELGVTRIIPVATAFAVVKLDGPKGEIRRQRWERIAHEASRQCARGDAPEILGVHSWGAAMAVVTSSGASLFCLYERAPADEPLGPRLVSALDRGLPLAFAAGPEGGLSEAEVAAAREAGADVVSLGAFVLRTETVAAATLGAVRVLEALHLPRVAADGA